MACDFCKKIWNNREEYEKHFMDSDYESVAIILDEDYGNKPSLYIPVEDYYSDTYLTIDYCPKCGRKLTEDASAPSTEDAQQWLFSDLDDTIDCF